MKHRNKMVWSSYKRKQININKAVFNDEVAQYLQQHYKYLHSRLVKYDKDEDTFNDTYLKLTYNYNPDKDFIEQFVYYFNLLKGAYYRDDRVANYYLDLVDDFRNLDREDIIIEDEVKKQKPSINDLKSKIHNAISKEKTKRASKED